MGATRVFLPQLATLLLFVSPESLSSLVWDILGWICCVRFASWRHEWEFRRGRGVGREDCDFLHSFACGWVVTSCPTHHLTWSLVTLHGLYHLREAEIVRLSPELPPLPQLHLWRPQAGTGIVIFVILLLYVAVTFVVFASDSWLVRRRAVKTTKLDNPKKYCSWAMDVSRRHSNVESAKQTKIPHFLPGGRTRRGLCPDMSWQSHWNMPPISSNLPTEIVDHSLKAQAKHPVYVRVVQGFPPNMPSAQIFCSTVLS